MLKVRLCADLKECHRLWEKFWPQECLFDLWAVRYCFAKHYAHPAEFYIAEESGSMAGMLPLSWITETKRYSFFPGELWQGKTWLEQNKIVAQSSKAARALLDSVSGPAHLRYLPPEYLQGIAPDDEDNRCVIDETGYVFSPAQYDYSFDKFMNTFSPRSRKKLTRELDPIETRGLRYRFDHYPDIEKLFQMNIGAFLEKSYFYDRRFRESFEDLASWLKAQGLLRITTLLIGDEVAAVDIGAVWNGCYTVLAGGTNPDFPGAAKIINFQHLQWACRQKITLVDFLCGDFGWKSRFRLQPRPLYLIDTSAETDANYNFAENHEFTGEKP